MEELSGSRHPASQPITMNPAWFLGALNAAPGSPGSMEVFDLFIFDDLLEDAQSELLLSYARDVKGVP